MWYIVGSDQWNRKQTSKKTSSTGKVKYGKDTNTTINKNVVTYNIDVPRGKSLSLKNPGKP